MCHDCSRQIRRVWRAVFSKEDCEGGTQTILIGVSLQVMLIGVCAMAVRVHDEVGLGAGLVGYLSYKKGFHDAATRGT